MALNPRPSPARAGVEEILQKVVFAVCAVHSVTAWLSATEATKKGRNAFIWALKVKAWRCAFIWALKVKAGRSAYSPCF